MDDNLQFLTQSGVNVTNLIKEGKTEKFTCRNQAYQHARVTGSYMYELNCYVDHKPQRIVQHYGFAVPN